MAARLACMSKVEPAGPHLSPFVPLPRYEGTVRRLPRACRPAKSSRVALLISLIAWKKPTTRRYCRYDRSKCLIPLAKTPQLPRRPPRPASGATQGVHSGRHSSAARGWATTASCGQGNCPQPLAAEGVASGRPLCGVTEVLGPPASRRLTREQRSVLWGGLSSRAASCTAGSASRSPSGSGTPGSNADSSGTELARRGLRPQASGARAASDPRQQVARLQVRRPSPAPAQRQQLGSSTTSPLLFWWERARRR